MSTNIVRDYLHEIGEYGLLTAKEEIELGTSIQAGIAARKELETCTDADRIEVLNDLASAGDFAREELILHNLKLVISVVKNYSNQHLSFMDMVNEGNLGLMTAADKFDPTKGCRFSTCAVPWIRQSITKAIIDGGKMIRIPAHIYQKLNKYRQTIAELTEKKGSQPYAEEIAAAMGITLEEVNNLEQWRQDTVSLESPINDEEEDCLLDLQADPNMEEPMNYALRLYDEQLLQDAIGTLKPRSQQIVKMRYGLGKAYNNDPAEWAVEHTLEEIGREVNLSKERVRQIIRESEGLIKTYLEGHTDKTENK